LIQRAKRILSKGSRSTANESRERYSPDVEKTGYMNRSNSKCLLPVKTLKDFSALIAEAEILT